MIKIANAPCSWGALEFDIDGKAPEYLQVLSEMKETGYEGTELGDWGFMPTDPAELNKTLQDLDLKLLGAFVPAALSDPNEHINGKELALRTAQLLYDADFVETPQEIDKLMQLTDPDLLGLCLDTGHYAFGGGDPVKALETYYPRIWHIHFKDYDPDVGRQVAEKILDNKGYEGWIVVEQDVLPGMGSPRDCAAHNRGFIKSLGL